MGWAPLEAVRRNNLHRVMACRRERHRMPDGGTVGRNQVTDLKLRLQRRKQKHLGGEMFVQVLCHSDLDYWTSLRDPKLSDDRRSKNVNCCMQKAGGSCILSDGCCVCR